ncbi:hypothetical protein [Hanstruepera flava]|uniref:hypothetical protein n=1 Tax=Hanstruepera flava TaxID=2930218 RepID=UPI0020293581|nr:hypothetical protein [Hanstruepera flava]
MSDKKHIDRVFQEKLKDFEVSPNPELWTKIQNELKLEDSQPKKVFPIWLRLASIAAVLAVLFTIGSFIFDNNEPKSDEPTTKSVENNTTPSLENNLKESNNKLLKSPETSTANIDDNKGNNSDINSLESYPKNSNTSILDNDNTANKVASKNNNSSLNKPYKNNKNELLNAETKSAQVSNVSSPNNNNQNGESSELNNAVSDTRTALSDPNSTNINTINNVSSNPEANKTQTAQAKNNSNPELDTDAANRALGKENTQDAIALNAMKGNNPHNEKEKEESLKVGDSLNNESPSIEEAIALAEELNEKEEEKEKLVNRWQVYANVAPVYYNSFGEGSHIDEQFVSNSKSGEVNMSYGVNVSYALSKKLAVRSGISSLNLSYDTDNVILYESPSSSTGNPINPMRNINLAPGSQSLNAFSGENLGFQQIISDLSNAAISQRLSYYEVPVELEYKLVNNRFSLGVIGGVSTFFLDDNEVYSEFEEYTTYIGEANNVNSVSFSTNLGIGMNYNFSEKFRFNLEPTFKYHLNAFNNTSGSFRPYIIGLYTGFSYKF